MTKSKPSREQRCLDSSDLAESLRKGCAETKALIESWDLSGVSGNYAAPMAGAIIKICEAFDRRNQGNETALDDAAKAICKALWPGWTTTANHCQEHMAVAGKMVADVHNYWTENAVTKSPFRSTIKFLTGENADKLGIYQLVVDLFEVKSGETGVVYPDLTTLGLTQVAPDMLDSFDAAFRMTELHEKFHCRFGIVNLPEQEADNIERYPVLFSGPSAQTAAICAMLAASGDPYCIGESSKKGQEIDTSVAISAQVGEELDANVANIGPKHVEKKEVAGVLQRKLADIDFKSQKLTAARAFGLSTVYFSEPELDRLKNQNAETGRIIQQIIAAQQNSGHLGLSILKVANVLEALDGVLLTNRHQKTMQQKIQTEWFRPWKTGTADFDPKRLSGNVPESN